MTARTYIISEIAEEFSLTLRALRFYESRGLIFPRRCGLKRIYSEADRERLRQITTWTRSGFTIVEIKGALASGGFCHEKLKEQIGHLSRQRDEIQNAILELEQLVAK
jgi:DNA-binding transcriptional MerR regulator